MYEYQTANTNDPEIHDDYLIHNALPPTIACIAMCRLNGSVCYRMYTQLTALFANQEQLGRPEYRRAFDAYNRGRIVIDIQSSLKLVSRQRRHLLL